MSNVITLLYRRDKVIKEFTSGNSEILSIKLQSIITTNDFDFVDFHNVLDLFESYYKFNKNLICVSYVGKKMILPTTVEIKNRLKSNQIILGILIYKRPRDDINVLYSKAWIIKLINDLFPKKERKFLDDGKDHINLVKKYVPEVKSILIPKNTNTKSIIVDTLNI